MYKRVSSIKKRAVLRYFALVMKKNNNYAQLHPTLSDKTYIYTVRTKTKKASVPLNRGRVG